MDEGRGKWRGRRLGRGKGAGWGLVKAGAKAEVGVLAGVEEKALVEAEFRRNEHAVEQARADSEEQRNAD